MNEKRCQANEASPCCWLVVAFVAVSSLSLLTGLLSCSHEMYEIPAEEIPSTGLPFFYLHTPDETSITRSLMENVSLLMTNSGPDTPDYSDIVMVKGRGNSSWVDPKKPYSIFFTQRNNLPGLPTGSNRLLLSNYKDMSLMRNELAFFMARELGGMTDAPQVCFVDFMLNGQYQGIYLLCESAEDICLREGDSFLVEVDGKARYHETTFNTSHMGCPISIHLPEVELGDMAYAEISNFIQQAEEVLYSDDFTDPERGYKAFFDMDSFVEWYLINEMSKNGDATFYTSCFIHFSPGGKMKMGPVWDFDIAFGIYPFDGKNEINNPEHFYIRNAGWYARLFDDPAFVSRVKERFAFYYSHRQDISDHIDATCRLLLDKVPLDNHLWGCLCDKSASEEWVKSAYVNEAENLKRWLFERMEWMHANLEDL